jgi:N-acetyl-gamma-glutamyl-phosphate reductase
MVKVAVIGASGYTALELILILLQHPQVELVRLTSRQSEQQCISEIHPALRSRLKLAVSNFDLADLLEAGVQCAFCCLPHGASAEIVHQLYQNSIAVIDFSADYRFNDWQSFEKWYNVQHPDRERIGKVPYGLPELFRQQIKGATLVANPGCFPTSAMIPLAPILSRQLVEPCGIIVDSKTGISGAGRTAQLAYHFPECNESVAGYSIGAHRHQPEIEQILGRFTGQQISVTFSPHLVPMNRGILSTIYARRKNGSTAEKIQRALQEHYAAERFVRVRDQNPTTRDVCHTNFCDISVRESGDYVILLSAIDNLVKGASGAAVQNFNLMYKFPETTAL